MACDVINSLQGFIMFCVVYFDRETIKYLRTKFGKKFSNKITVPCKTNYTYTPYTRTKFGWASTDKSKSELKSVKESFINDVTQICCFFLLADAKRTRS